MYIRWKLILWRNKSLQVIGNSIVLLRIANNKQLQRGRQNLYWEISGRLQSGKREVGCRISKLIPLTPLPQTNQWNVVDPHSGWERQQAVILSPPPIFFCSQLHPWPQRGEALTHPALWLLPAQAEPDTGASPPLSAPRLNCIFYIYMFAVFSTCSSQPSFFKEVDIFWSKLFWCIY